MAKLESTVMIARPVEQVFRFFLDLDGNARKTDPNIESVARTPEGPTRPGTTFHFRQRALGRMRETTTTFVAIEPNRKIEMDARLGPIRPKGAITFDQTNLGTVVTVRLNPNPVAQTPRIGLRQNRPESVGQQAGSAQGSLGGLAPRRRRLIAMHWRAVGPDSGVAYEKPR